MTDPFANAAEFASVLGDTLTVDEFRDLAHVTFLEGYLNRLDEAWGDSPLPPDEQRALARRAIADGLT